MALPYLGIMERTGRAAHANPAPPTRAAFFYIPNGVVQSSWHPKETGKNFALSPTLEPLQAIREKISVYTHLDRIKVAGTDGHAQAGACWLSSAAPDQLSPAGYPLKQTLDQIMAFETGKETAFRSLELSCNSYQDNKESVYFDNISWYGHGHVARSMRDPQRVFERLFAIKEHRDRSSVLDLVLEDAKSLHRQLGKLDQHKLDEYLDSVRTVEQQIHRIKSRQQAIADMDLKAPTQAWTTMRRDEHIQIMGDLMILAFQTDLTRVASIMVSPERWSTPQMIHGVFDKPIVHHNMTHGQGNPKVKEQLAKLDLFHVGEFSKLVAKMDAIQEGEGTLLDHSLFTLGSGLSSGKTHIYSDLPTVIAGSGNGAMQTNRHIQYEEGTPLGNLWLTLAQTMGSKINRFADSTGPLNLRS